MYFGKKDAQQLILIKKLVEYMKYPICVVPCDTVREHHGLAMSSRNEYLNTSDRGRAKIIYLSLLEAKKMLDKGETQYNIIKNKIESILRIEPDINIDYISIANSETLDEYDEIIRGKILISVAVFFCGVRLIDNIFYYSHVGDTRIYSIKEIFFSRDKFKIAQLTEDDNLIGNPYVLRALSHLVPEPSP